MDYSNYTLFEIIKYKIEFLNCLEYSLLTYKPNTKQIEESLEYLKAGLNTGFYYNIVSTLFNDYNLLNKPIKKFLKDYTSSKIGNNIFRKKAHTLIKFNESLIDCYETFKYIINSFLEEEEIFKKLDNRIISLIKISDEHFINFLFFNTYTLTIYCINNVIEIKFNTNNIKRMCFILNYCNRENKFDKAIEVFRNGNEEELTQEFKKISNTCIKTEEKLDSLMNDLLTFINKEITKDE